MFHTKADTYSISQLLHLDLVRSADCAFMVAENSHFTVAIVVKFDLLLDSACGWFELFEQSRHSVRCIVSTENFGTQTRHVVVEMLVELCSLERQKSVSILSL